MIYHMKEVLTNYEIISLIGKRFKVYRKAMKISQQMVHENTGVAKSTISLFENGKGQGLSLAHFLLLLESVGVDIDYGSVIPEVHNSNLAKLWRDQNK